MKVTELPTLVANAATIPYARVKLTAGELVVAGAEDIELGTVNDRVLAADDKCVLVPRNTSGVVMMVAAGAIAQYADVYGAASGKVDDTANSNYIGVALSAAIADGDNIKVLRVPTARGAVRRVAAKTADYTVTAADSGSVFTTVGASGTVVFSLPAATVGLEYMFKVGAAQELRIDPNGTETISLPSSGVAGAAGKYLTANAAGESAYFVCCDAGTWTCLGYTGTWTSE